MNAGRYPIQIMQNDEYVVVFFEQNTWFNVIYLDGRDHPRGSQVRPGLEIRWANGMATRW